MTDRAAYLLFLAIRAVLRLLPVGAVCALGSALGWVGWLVGGPYRRLARRNVQIAFGREMDDAAQARLVRRAFQTLGANLFSSIKIASMTREEIEARLEIEGLEHIQAAVDAGRGLVCIVSHLGNWELFAQVSPWLFGCKCGTVYQRLGNALMDAEVRRTRARLGLALFERKEGFDGALKLLREGGAVGVLADQHAGDAGMWCPFFDRLASTSPLAATMALRARAAIIPVAAYSAPGGKWRLVFLPPVQAPERTIESATVAINRVVETQIRRQPEDWFWVHNRWKTPRPRFLLAGYKRGVIVPPGAQLQPFRILVRSSNWLGDAVMNAPAVRAIKAGRPDAQVVVLCPAKLADFWRALPGVDEVLPIPPGESVFAVAQNVRAANCEVAVIFPNSIRTALEPWLAGIARRVGVPGHRPKWFLTQPWLGKKKRKGEAPPLTQHHATAYLEMAEFIGADISSGALHAPQIRNQKSQIINPVLGLCPGAEFGGAKRWLPERFAETMREIHARHACEWRIFGVEKDRPIADAIVAQAGCPATDLVGKTTLAELIARLRECDLLLTNDTGTMHLAASLGVPVVAIFGSTDPEATGPLGPQHRILRHEVECAPCFQRECPIDFPCMKGVTVADAVAAVEATLAEVRPK